ncbi:hypothetical protein PF005_g6495 [Phytophthora fragariae]|uniref:Uncharacterized protein n=1 Tax=Phytophthora fragariae TaxID=53985 RepID=A0A6A3Q321_9STRA|nr:hypothetical protein PF003_g38451 [Phytophthora fragariae]KAE8943002.1 hypothetical protein PF009_g7250 [Phytophthora fragariae]KAE9068060.1 hypothetical protein PF007_g27834 [Phytophthora fragariae]KAE9079732.1 hypothetical protein PF006_g27459 [Phytophthora fragariae]KAE9222943.1 hypothetical protein PF005_g6495 [Phytophthora fragariae]
MVVHLAMTVAGKFFSVSSRALFIVVLIAAVTNVSFLVRWLRCRYVRPQRRQREIL